MRTCSSLTLALSAWLISAACVSAPSAEPEASTSAATAVPAAAQATPGAGWGPQDPYGRRFDAAAVETMTGVVVRMENATPVRGMSRGVHVILRGSAGETIPVHLGPAWFVDNQEFAVQPGDTLEVTGSRVIFDSGPALIACKVVKGGEELVLRDPAGIPVWSAARRRRTP